MNVQTLSQKLTQLPSDEKAAQRFGQIKADLKKGGEILLDADIMIAAIALANDCVLVTNNVRHFNQISGLTVENWKTTSPS